MCSWLTGRGVPTSLEAWRAKPRQEQVDLQTIRRMESESAAAARQMAANQEEV